MPSALAAPRVGAVLSRLYAAATRDSRHSSPSARARPMASPAERSEAFQDVSFPVSAEVGKLLYAVARASRPETVVEFGTSFGVSTIYLAAAVADNGAGHIVTTELSSKKVEAAWSNLRQAGLGGSVTVLAGDARETLARVAGPVGLVLLDGWKDLFLPVIRLLEPRLAPGALVIANDGKLASAAAYLSYVREPASGYVTVAFPNGDGIEISSWTGR
jgi:predicted O-methyltransferase YrrM